MSCASVGPARSASEIDCRASARTPRPAPRWRRSWHRRSALFERRPSSRSSSAATSAAGSAVVASISACHGCVAGKRRAGSRDVRSTSSSESCGTISKPSTLSVRASSKRSRSSAPAGLGDPDPGHRARRDRRDQPQRDGGDDAERAFGADQQLVEAVAAIVLLERRTGRGGPSRRAAPPPRPRPARASSRSAAPACRRHWSRSARRWCAAARAEGQRKAQPDLARALVQIGEDHPGLGDGEPSRR